MVNDYVKALLLRPLLLGQRAAQDSKAVGKDPSTTAGDIPGFYGPLFCRWYINGYVRIPD